MAAPAFLAGMFRPIASAKSCGGCAYWGGVGRDPAIGDCRRHAPAYVENPQSNSFEHKGFPRTWEREWCGDFERRKP